MTHPEQPDDSGMGGGRPSVDRQVNTFFLVLIGCGTVFLIAAWLWGGLDFASAELLGFIVVALNVYWTKRAVKSVLFDSRPKALLTVSYLFKLGLTAFILYYGIVHYQIDPLGVLLGLTSLLLATIIFALFFGRQG